MKMVPQTNIDVLRHILRYCEKIDILIERFGFDVEIFKKDMAYRDSVSLNLLQIGELTGRLSDEYRNQTRNKMQWAAMKGMRNLFAHNYGEMDVNVIWSTAIECIPPLKEFCLFEITRYDVLNQDENQSDYETQDIVDNDI